MRRRRGIPVAESGGPYFCILKAEKHVQVTRTHQGFYLFVYF